MRTRQTLLSASGSWHMDRETAAVIAAARTLRHLLHAEPSFHVINRHVADHMDVDHVVAGPTGVFAIETASDDDIMSVDPRGRLAHDGCQENLRAARRAAASVRERLRRRGFDLNVQAVLCLPFAPLQRPQYVDQIIVSRPEPLEYLIRHWPGQVLSATLSTRVFAALQPRVHRVAA